MSATSSGEQFGLPDRDPEPCRTVGSSLPAERDDDTEPAVPLSKLAVPDSIRPHSHQEHSRAASTLDEDALYRNLDQLHPNRKD